jgi:hypothetical protein
MQCAKEYGADLLVQIVQFVTRMKDLELGGKGFHLDHGGSFPLSGSKK